MMEAKLKHLEFLQAVIARMSNASFLFKGWSITLAGALFAFAVVNDRSSLVIIAVGTTVLFWGLDGYYLWLERRFIDLYAKVTAIPNEEIDFAMAIDRSKALRRWLRTCARFHLLSFYGIIVAVEIIGIFVVRGGSNGT